MVTIKCSQQLCTMRHVKGFRSGRTSMGYSRRPAESRRLQLAAVTLRNRELKRRWLEHSWQLHAWLCRSLRSMEWDTP
jgi:hypothetical protein